MDVEEALIDREMVEGVVEMVVFMMMGSLLGKEVVMVLLLWEV